jgi:hypothetical protein
MKQSDLCDYEENAREKHNIQYTSQKHQLPLKSRNMDGKHQFSLTNQQIEKNQGVW